MGKEGERKKKKKDKGVLRTLLQTSDSQTPATPNRPGEDDSTVQEDSPTSAVSTPMRLTIAEKPSTIVSPNLEDQTSNTPVLVDLRGLVEVLRSFLTTDGIISGEDSAESKWWSSNLATYLTEVGAICESLFRHFTQGVLDCSNKEAKKLVERVNTPLVTQLLASYASLCKWLHAKHKRYL